MPVGTKAVYLPNFTISLVRTPHLPANFAQFVVPLNINKLDLRDYLKNVYDVDVYNVRSFIVQQKLQRTRPERPEAVDYWRPRAVKKMTVELVKPFVYPAEPEDLSPWDNELWKALEKQRDISQKTLGPYAYKEPNPDRSRLKALASEVLSEKSTTTTTEVEKEISVR
ncbi:hypothetical protein BZA05DRAFT_446527 [Tricharina praecox]|uniref:uncharacterized protein n=1 Tax=Tricharina praecox TaxID=43433 RepID=UPI00221ED9AF|nr:uncharacterized protein BZA05DRAFT_446527 [Tricharina praecox]KAI5848229.1 hypothetical protein BZA05DRAFT_446527 [Tricharina praecox]